MANEAKMTWSENLAEEVAFWRRWLTEDEFKRDREARLRSRHLGIPADLVNAPKGSTVRILDVGSGPLSTVGESHPDYTIELQAVDPLADQYNQLLVELGFQDRASLTRSTGEDLSAVFSESMFDVVCSANALDHAFDPLRCITNMLKVCKPGGWTYIVNVENEGERQDYHGLHQWNFELVGENVRLWNSTNDINIRAHLGEVKQFIARPVDHGNNLPMFELRIQK